MQNKILITYIYNKFLYIWLDIPWILTKKNKDIVWCVWVLQCLSSDNPMIVQ